MPPTRLPPAESPAQYDAVRLDEAALQPGVRAICARHGVRADAVTRFAAGSLPVYAVGDAHVVKLFPPYDRYECETEQAVLVALDRRLPVPTPAPVATGALDGWSYVVMSRLHGRGLAEAWPAIPQPDREALATQLGEALAALHAIDPAGLPLACPGYPAFLRAQREGCAERQVARRTPAAWAAQIPAFLAEVALPEDPPVRLLHTEVMREHLLVREAGGRWALSGLFDFEPAMAGPPEYEFASVGVFATCGDPTLLRPLLRGYGHRADALDQGLRRRFMAHALLHRYSNLRWYLERVPPAPGVTTLDALAAQWWA